MRLQDQDRTADLLKKFPAVKAAIARLEDSTSNDRDRVYVSVARLDQAVLANTPLLCSGEGVSLVDPDLPGLLGWQHDVYFAVDANDEIIGQIGAIRPDDQFRDSRPVKHLVLMHRAQVSYLVRLTMTGWCRRLTEWRDSPLGELDHRDIAVTVYREPDEGFDGLLARVWTDQNLRMHFRSGGRWADNPDVDFLLSRLLPLMRDFETRTFFDGFLETLPVRCMGGDGEGKLGEVSYDCSNWEDEGRKVRLTLSRGEVSISFFYVENPLSMFHHGGHLSLEAMEGTLEEAHQLLEAANVGWVRKKIGEDKIAELQGLWRDAVQVTSTVYVIRLPEEKIDWRAEVDRCFNFIANEGDVWAVEVPIEADERFQKLVAEKQLDNPDPEKAERVKAKLKWTLREG